MFHITQYFFKELVFKIPECDKRDGFLYHLSDLMKIRNLKYFKTLIMCYLTEHLISLMASAYIS